MRPNTGTGTSLPLVALRLWRAPPDAGSRGFTYLQADDARRCPSTGVPNFDVCEPAPPALVKGCPIATCSAIRPSVPCAPPPPPPPLQSRRFLRHISTSATTQARVPFHHRSILF